MSDRYRLSFTTGGLFLREASTVVARYLAIRDWRAARDEVRQENLLQVRTAAAATRISKEVTARLELLDDAELEALQDVGLREQAYLRMFHQQRSLMELLETVSKVSGPEEEVAVHVVTVEDEFNGDKQTENFQKMADACTSIGIQFSWAYDKTGTKHDRDIMTDLGWKIVLSRGLDVFQRFELNDAFSFTNRMQQHRQCKEFNVTFVKVA